ncbi:MAG: hypothetical protein DRI44_03805 [Chlamydiae bacterium]|nr:MAG: hypothetical protein DRI44_03805 [Chlamydiota bacterium]
MNKNKSKQKENKQPKWLAVIKETVGLVLLLAFFFFLKSNTIELFKIPTGSMEPTLYGANEMGHGFGDHLLVLRSAYGFSSKIKIPFLNWHVPLPDYRIMIPGMRLPKVGDVVVFENPTDSKIDYIKRCAGIPGNHVKIKKGHLFINDKIVTNSPATANYVYYTNAGILCDRFVSVRAAVDSIIDKQLVEAAKTNAHVRNELFAINPDYARFFASAINHGGGLLSMQFKMYIPQIMSIAERYHVDKIKDSILINGKPYRVVEKQVQNKSAGFNPVTDTIVSEIVVPQESYFMLGDNSAASADSRYWGFVPIKLIKGRAWCIYLPVKRIRMIK